MALTQNTYTGDGSTVLFSFTFPYLDAADIRVSLNGTLTTAYTLSTATTVRFNAAPANGAAIRIFRQTKQDALRADFYPGSAIRAQDLNDDFAQILYVTQESDKTSADAYAVATGIDAKATEALVKSGQAVSTANDAHSIASGIDGKATQALANSNTAVNTANDAHSIASGIDGKATDALRIAGEAKTTADGIDAKATQALSESGQAVTEANQAKSDARAGYHPAGTTAQRPQSPSAGLVRYNTDTNQFEGYGSAWDSIGGGAKGASGNQVFFENDQHVTASYTITTGKNAVTAGPVTINSGVTVTIPTGSSWVIV